MPFRFSWSMAPEEAPFQRVVEPGAFDIMAGDNSAVLKTAVLTVAG